MQAAWASPSSGEPPSDKYLGIATELARNGWVVSEGFFSAAEAAALRADIHRHWQHGEFRRAAVGRGEAMQVRNEVRRDHILWLDGASAAQQAYLAEMESLRLAFNAALFLGLFEYEAHLALYPPGAFYRRHLDQHVDSDSRVVSAVTYLNDGWCPQHGGELRLFVGGGAEERVIDIAPRAGTLVCFLSGVMYHEVLTTQAPRYSITGWFRRRAS